MNHFFFTAVKHTIGYRDFSYVSGVICAQDITHAHLKLNNINPKISINIVFAKEISDKEYYDYSEEDFQVC